jgi:hypothetical protein
MMSIFRISEILKSDVFCEETSSKWKIWLRFCIFCQITSILSWVFFTWIGEFLTLVSSELLTLRRLKPWFLDFSRNDGICFDFFFRIFGEYTFLIQKKAFFSADVLKILGFLTCLESLELFLIEKCGKIFWKLKKSRNFQLFLGFL